jgi:hypothetical protein
VANPREFFFPKEPRLTGVSPISGFAPVGLTSYGSNGSVVRTSGVRGITTVNGMGIGYFSAIIPGNGSTYQLYNGYGNASVQENAVLWLGGGLGTYWTQNVVLITENSASSYTLQLVNNIWNFTSISSNMNAGGISGKGSVQCVTVNGAVSCAYIWADPVLLTVKPPFTMNLTMSLLTSGGGGAANVAFLYQIQDSTGANFQGQYDSVKLIPSSPTQSSYFQIGGESPVSETLGGSTTLTLPSDLELVFGGPGGGSSVFVNSISGAQKLFYLNAGGNYSPVPDAFSIGSDTAEQASGIQVNPDFTNTQEPAATLDSGAVSARKIWPLPFSLILSGSNQFQNNSLSLQGVALYSPNSSSPATGIAGLALYSSSGEPAFQTSSSGGFQTLFRPTKGAGIYHEMISYLGSPAFLEENLTFQIAVSSISISGAAGARVVAEFNSTQTIIENESSILVPVLQGSSVVVSFQNSTIGSGTQQQTAEFSGFSGQAQKSVVLNGNTSQNLVANFVQGGASSSIAGSPISATVLLYLVVAAVVALVVGLVIGYLVWGRRSKGFGVIATPPP